MQFFSDNFLKLFLLSDEPFAVIDKTLYTLEKKNGSITNISFNISNNVYVMEESEKIVNLEKIIFDKNKIEIEKNITNFIKNKYLVKVENANNELKKLSNIFSTMENNSIEAFIIEDVFSMYNHAKKQDINVDVKSPEYELPKLNSFNETDSLSDILNLKDFLVLGGRTYILKPSNEKNQIKGFVQKNNSIFSLIPNISLVELCNAYKNNLEQTVYKIGNEHGRGINKTLELLELQKSNIKAAIEKNNENNLSQKTEGKIGFRKKSRNEYQINLHIPQFIMERENKYYHFKSVNIGFNVYFNQDVARIKKVADVLDDDYFHPFVYSDKNICYGKTNFEKSRGVKIGRNYSFKTKKDKKIFAKKIIEVLNEGQRKITQGYVGTKLVPVNNISKFDPIAKTRQDAVQYASKHNIPEYRIILNPK